MPNCQRGRKVHLSCLRDALVSRALAAMGDTNHLAANARSFHPVYLSNAPFD